MSKAWLAAALLFLVPARAAAEDDSEAARKKLLGTLDGQAKQLDASTQVGELGKFVEGADADLATLAKTSPSDAKKLEELRARLKSLPDRARGKSDKGEKDQCLIDNKEETKRAACELRGLHQSLRALELGNPSAAAVRREPDVVAAPEANGTEEAYRGPLPREASAIPALRDAVAERTVAQTRDDLALLLRASGDRRFYQGTVGEGEQAKAITTFQRRQGMNVTGRMDDETKKAIVAKAAERREASQYMPQRGEESENVRLAQERLRKLFPRVALDPDGKFGNKTAAAVCRLQGKKGEDCALDDATWQKLVAATTPKQRELDKAAVPEPTVDKARLAPPKQAPIPPESIPAAAEEAARIGLSAVGDTLRGLTALPLADRGGLDNRAIELAARYFDKQGDKVQNQNAVTIVDTAQRRMHVIDVPRIATDPDHAITTTATSVSARGFSGTAKNHTELGVYITADKRARGGRILGGIPIMQLQGQTPPSREDVAGNRRAWDAGILFHPNYIIRGGKQIMLPMERSNGCFHVAGEMVDWLFKKVQGGSVVLAYHPRLLPDSAIERSVYVAPPSR